MDGCLKSIRVSRDDSLDLINYSNLFKSFDILNAHIVSLPLRNRSNEVLGSLVLNLPISPADYASSAPIPSELLAFLDALSGTAAVAIDNQKMIQDQKILLESLIQLVAGAIDAKSPYSGSHCQRVPELTKMLAQAACEKNDGPFAHFSLTEGDRETLHIASWLHDCGKVTTPEFVVDKATKLETIYDRIHEIRMRFEVLKRDAEISAYQEALYKFPAETINMDELQKVIIQKCSILDEEFNFIAACNVGDEFMSPDKVERLNSIAERRWLRTIDDSLGISYPELLRRKDQQKTKLPVFENLISDKPEHIFPRVGRDVIDTENNPWGFKISSPENLYNRGELYNLSIARGTLTNEERYKINEHIIQTIKMLSALPFPKHLSRVTEIAGGHHEKMDGTGYPYRLSQQEMSIEARIMAIADIFEALTAVDRPYKKGRIQN
ncbi:MAG: HD domain-containing protein [Burkholderiaceae bacterium]|nr:HD domain-containing protein [Burkholderiaceae bacterium]MBY0455696.1 HD domain-containing protein [Burkholderiaceae bacterium]